MCFSLSTTDGVTTRYAYDAAGCMVREGNKRYTYGYLDKVLSVTDGDTTRTFTYHADGQLATANYGRDNVNRETVGRDDPIAPTSESFLWDGLALIQRGDEQFMNEPHVGGGNPVASSKGTSYFNDALGTTVGSWEGRASSRPESGLKYSAAALTAFGESLPIDKQIDAEIDKAEYTVVSVTLVSINPDIEEIGGAWFIHGCKFKWEVVYE